MKTLILAALIAALVLLAACGGGDPEPIDEHVPAPRPVNCQASPAICK